MKIEVNALGLICPEPIMLLHKAIRDSDSGDLIELVASDKSTCLLYTSPSPRDRTRSRMPSSA